MTEYWRWTATEMAAAVASGEVSSRELVTSCLERIDATNPHLNALVEVRPEEALAQADEADRSRAAGGELGTLHGVPVSTKVNVNQVGYPTTQGVTAFRDDFPTQVDPHIAAFRRAGAVLFGRSNSPSFAYRWVTDNELHGRTLNPWDATRSPGGSSGGGAASVATGMLPISQGNDIGGSVRYPAFACGVVGFRPSVGMVVHYPEPEPNDMRLSVQIMAVEGPLTRTVADARLTLIAFTTHTPEDNVYPEWVPGAPVAPPARHPQRVGLVRRVGVDKPAPAIDAALDTAANALRAEGYDVEEIDVPQLHDAYRLWYLLAMEEFRALQPLFNQLAGEGMRRCAENYMAVSSQW